MQSAFLFERYYCGGANLRFNGEIFPLLGAMFVSPLNANLIRNLSNGTFKLANESGQRLTGEGGGCSVCLIVNCASAQLPASIFIRISRSASISIPFFHRSPRHYTSMTVNESHRSHPATWSSLKASMPGSFIRGSLFFFLLPSVARKPRAYRIEIVWSSPLTVFRAVDENP